MEERSHSQRDTSDGKGKGRSNLGRDHHHHRVFGEKQNKPCDTNILFSAKHPTQCKSVTLRGHIKDQKQ